MEAEGENPLFLDEDEEAVLLQTTINFQSTKKADHRNALYLSGSEDDLEDKLARAEKVINFLLFNILIGNKRIYPLTHINAVAPEIERLCDAIHKASRGLGKKKWDLTEEEIQKVVFSEYNYHRNEFKHLNDDHLKISYVLTEKQERRDLIGPILENYILSKGIKSPGAQTLYKIYNQIRKYNNRM